MSQVQPIRDIAQVGVQRYLDDGFLAVPELLSGQEVDELKADLLKLARGGYACDSLEPVPSGISDEEAVQRILCIHMPHFVSPLIHRYTRHPEIADILGRIVGAHLAEGLWNGGVKCMQSMFFAKPPGKPGQAWHQDEVFIPTRDRSLCGVWIAVDDATIDNGCLWVLPGSHRSGRLYPYRDHDRPDMFDVSPESYGFDDTTEIPIELKAGSVLFFNGYLLHRSKPNASGHYRRSLVNHYMNAQSPLTWCLDGQEFSGRVPDNRAVHMVCGEDPYAEDGYVVPEGAVYLRQHEVADT